MNFALRISVAAAALTALAPGPVLGQSQNDVSPQLWVDYNPSWRASPKFELYGDIGARTELESDGWWRFVVRPSVRYQLNREVQLSGGVGSFYTWNDLISDRWELRPWQGVRATWPRIPVPVEHFLRFEERFDFNTRTWESLNSLRMRYRLRSYFDWEAKQSGRHWRVMGSVEGFLTLAGEQGQFQEQFRLSIGLERSYRPGLRARIDATWQKEGGPFQRGLDRRSLLARSTVHEVGSVVVHTTAPTDYNSKHRKHLRRCFLFFETPKRTATPSDSGRLAKDLPTLCDYQQAR